MDAKIYNRRLVCPLCGLVVNLGPRIALGGAPSLDHGCRIQGQPVQMKTEYGSVPVSDWAEMLIERDPVQGNKVLERMIEFYEENDGKADDMGRLFIVTDALRALRREE